jgi:hypothetical protein
MEPSSGSRARTRDEPPARGDLDPPPYWPPPPDWKPSGQGAPVDAWSQASGVLKALRRLWICQTKWRRAAVIVAATLVTLWIIGVVANRGGSSANVTSEVKKYEQYYGYATDARNCKHIGSVHNDSTGTVDSRYRCEVYAGYWAEGCFGVNGAGNVHDLTFCDDSGYQNP